MKKTKASVNAISEYRRIHRLILFRDSKNDMGAYTEKEYREKIKVHYKTLMKYIDNFNEWFMHFYDYVNIFTKIKIRIILGESFEKYYNNHIEPSINDIYKLFCYCKLKKDFKHYFCRKTFFSYGVPFHTTTAYGSIDSYKLGYKNDKNKFAEFVYLILAEYIILHNWMWCSKLKPKQVSTSDSFLKNM